MRVAQFIRWLGASVAGVALLAVVVAIVSASRSSGVVFSDNAIDSSVDMPAQSESQTASPVPHCLLELSGHIQDVAGLPVEGVLVSVRTNAVDGESLLESDASGFFDYSYYSVCGAMTATLVVRATKAGYAPWVGAPDPEAKHVSIVMERL